MFYRGSSLNHELYLPPPSVPPKSNHPHAKVFSVPVLDYPRHLLEQL